MLEEILYDSHSSVKCYLKEDDMFGEQAALRDGFRSASVRATEDCHLAYLSKEDFDHLYSIHMKAKVDRGIQFLKAIPLFSSLSKHYVQRMTGMLHRKEVIKGQYIFHQSKVHTNSLLEVRQAYIANNISFSNYQFATPEQKKRVARYLYVIANGEFEITMKT